MGKEQQVQINRMIEALEMIADMPSVDPELNLTVGQVAAQYEEARETARLAVAQCERSKADVDLETGEAAPAARCAQAVMDLFREIDAMPAGDALKVITVLKARLAVSLFTRGSGKGAAHA